ncbi:MAG: hypothetical protein ACRD1R_18580 [Acidobacteriota bacterium]
MSIPDHESMVVRHDEQIKTLFRATADIARSVERLAELQREGQQHYSSEVKSELQLLAAITREHAGFQNQLKGRYLIIGALVLTALQVLIAVAITKGMQ